MPYTSDILQYIVTVLNKQTATGFGETTTYSPVGCVHADITWKKGQKALNEGALDAQDTVLIRMRWNNIVKRDSRLQYDGVTYQIQSFHPDRRDDTIQITATELANQKSYKPSASGISGGSNQTHEVG